MRGMQRKVAVFTITLMTFYNASSTAQVVREGSSGPPPRPAATPAPITS